jgi:hypothetical protein
MDISRIIKFFLLSKIPVTPIQNNNALKTKKCDSEIMALLSLSLIKKGRL